jgi:hypothetical protein
VTTLEPPEFPKDRRKNQDWLIALFTAKHSDLQWTKAQSWSATNWTVLLLAAVYKGFDEFKHIPKCVWLVFIGSILACSVIWLCHLHSFAKEARKDLKELLPQQNPLTEYPERPNHWLLLAAQIVVVSVAAAVIASEVYLRSPRIFFSSCH